MKISVAMCTYNGALFLNAQLQSIAAQVRPPDELVVCDDGSQDATAGIVQSFAETASFPVHLHINEHNLGVVRNFEKAMSLCQGDVIALSDQDDVWLPEKLRRFEEEYLKDENVGLVCCDVELVDEDLSPLNYKGWDLNNFTKERQKDFRAGNSFSYLLDAPYMCGCAMSFRSIYKDLVLPIPTNFENVIHDYWASILVGAVSKIAILPEPLVKYRQYARQQIGLLKHIPGSSSGKAQNHLLKTAFNKYSFEQELQRLEAIRQRLLGFAPDPAMDFHRNALSELEQRIIHLRSRNKIQTGAARRLPIVLRELASRRYSRYSRGIRSAVKDLLF